MYLAEVVRPAKRAVTATVTERQRTSTLIDVSFTRWQVVICSVFARAMSDGVDGLLRLGLQSLQLSIISLCSRTTYKSNFHKKLQMLFFSYFTSTMLGGQQFCHLFIKDHHLVY